MKPKKARYDFDTTSEESDEESKESVSAGSADSSSQSDSSDDHKRSKKRKKAASSESDSESEHRHKKRKHKKKKKKHFKKKRRTNSEDSESGEASSDSEKEVKKRKKHKKHKYNRRSSSYDSRDRSEKRLQSVVKEPEVSSAEEISEHSVPRNTYYPREQAYHSRSRSVEIVRNDRPREREVDRFYRGSSKDRSIGHRHDYHDREHHEDRYPVDERQRQKPQYREEYNGNDQYQGPRGRPRQYQDNHPRPPRYDERQRFEHEYQRQPRHDNGHYERPPREQEYQPRYNQRDQKPMLPRPPPEPREYQDKRDRGAERYRDLGAGNGPPYRRDKPNDSRRADPRRDGRGGGEREGERRDRREDMRENKPDLRARSPRKDDKHRSEERPGPSKDKVKTEPRGKPKRSRFNDEPEPDFAWGKPEVKEEPKGKVEKAKPNFGLSGKLAAEANTVNGVLIKYTEPTDAKQPKRRWRFYPFKGDKPLPILYIHRQSCFILGRDHKAVDIPLDHPSISKQHAALQYRATPFTRPDGTQGKRVRPYVIDLDSANGTFVNNKKIEARRFVELLERDVVKFGFSQREYVLLHENSKDEAQDDDNEPQEIGAGVTTTDQIKQEKQAKKAEVEDGE